MPRVCKDHTRRPVARSSRAAKKLMKKAESCDGKMRADGKRKRPSQGSRRWAGMMYLMRKSVVPLSCAALLVSMLLAVASERKRLSTIQYSWVYAVAASAVSKEVLAYREQCKVCA